MTDNNTTYKSAFFIVPSRILELPDLTLAFLKFYETIFQFWNHGQKCYLSNDSIMERTGIKSKSTIDDAFNYFEKHNEMKRVYKTNKRYIVQPTRAIETDPDPNEPVDNFDKNSTKTSQPLAPASGGSRSSEWEGLAPARHNNNKLNNKNIIKQQPVKNINTEQKSTVKFWGIGHPDYDRLHGVNRNDQNQSTRGLSNYNQASVSAHNDRGGNLRKAKEYLLPGQKAS